MEEREGAPGTGPGARRVQHVEVARAETGRGELVLRERREGEGPAVLELRVDGVFVTDTREAATERVLTGAALAEVEEPRAVVVGGLGLGFTVREVLGDHRVERVAVVEIEEALVGWMRDGTVPHGPAVLADARVTMVVADVAAAFAEARPASYDLVLLDVDNGPGYLVHDGNAALYRAPFLTSVRASLRPGGVVAVWSSAPSPTLHEALSTTFGACESRGLPVLLNEREETYWLYLARA